MAHVTRIVLVLLILGILLFGYSSANATNYRVDVHGFDFPYANYSRYDINVTKNWGLPDVPEVSIPTYTPTRPAQTIPGIMADIAQDELRRAPYQQVARAQAAIYSNQAALLRAQTQFLYQQLQGVKQNTVRMQRQIQAAEKAKQPKKVEAKAKRKTQKRVKPTQQRAKPKPLKQVKFKRRWKPNLLADLPLEKIWKSQQKRVKPTQKRAKPKLVDEDEFEANLLRLVVKGGMKAKSALEFCEQFDGDRAELENLLISFRTGILELHRQGLIRPQYVEQVLTEAHRCLW